MLYKLDDYWKDEILKAASLVNGTKKKDDCGDFIHIGNDTYIEVENLLSWIENLDYEIEYVQEELRDTIQDMEDNCVRRSAWEDSGMSYHDFI